jgi:hypothetical protein
LIRQGRPWERGRRSRPTPKPRLLGRPRCDYDSLSLCLSLTLCLSLARSLTPRLPTPQAEKKAATTSAADKAKEDAYWDAHANPVAKRDLKKEAAAAKAAEAAKKKAELAELKRAEEAAMASASKKKVQAPKLTKREIDSHKEKQRLQYEQMDAEKRASLKKTIGVDTYERMLDERVDNRMESVMDARSLDEAVRQMGGVAVDDMAEVDRHPERRAKALFAAYFERRLPELKEEKPGLKLMAYKARCFDEWQRSPENPRNFTK